MKEQGNTSGKKLDEIDNVPNNEFKVMVIKMLAELGGEMDEQSKNFNNEMGSIGNTKQKSQS